MRLVCIADTHLYDDALGELPDGDVLVHAGDLLRGGRLVELEYAADWLNAQPHRHKIVIAGNHDWCFARSPKSSRSLLGPGVTYLEDSGTTIDGVQFWGSPWQPEFYDWAFNLPRGEALARKWSLIPTHVDVLVTHGPPRGYGDRVGESRQGCDDLLEAIDRAEPALHMFGHIHEDGGLWRRGASTLVNVTVWECTRRPSVLDYDAATRTVTPIDIPPSGRQDD